MERIVHLCVIASDDDRLWRDSAKEVVRVLRGKVAELKACEMIHVNLITDLEAATGFLTSVCVPDILCIITHPSAPVGHQAVSLYGQAACLALVSGGRVAVSQDLETALNKERLITFDCAYGKEKQFAAWLQAWFASGLNLKDFIKTEGVLQEPKQEYRPLCQAIQIGIEGVAMVLQNYMALVRHEGVSHDPEIRGRSAAHNGPEKWLSERVAAVITAGALLDEMQSNARQLMQFFHATEDPLPLPLTEIDKVVAFISHNADVIRNETGSKLVNLPALLATLASGRLSQKETVEFVQECLERLEVSRTVLDWLVRADDFERTRSRLCHDHVLQFATATKMYLELHREHIAYADRIEASQILQNVWAALTPNLDEFLNEFAGTYYYRMRPENEVLLRDGRQCAQVIGQVLPILFDGTVDLSSEDSLSAALFRICEVMHSMSWLPVRRESIKK